MYGILTRAFDKKAVDKVYKIKGRDSHKPCIILITSFSDLEKFSLKISDNQKKFLKNIWPGKVSVVFPYTKNKLKYLHRGTKTMAFRMIGPKNRNLFQLIKSIGPLIAPSANPQGKKPAVTILEAKKYFENNVDLYIDGGTRKSKPSTLVEYKKCFSTQVEKLVVLRNGIVKI